MQYYKPDDLWDRLSRQFTGEVGIVAKQRLSVAEIRIECWFLDFLCKHSDTARDV